MNEWYTKVDKYGDTWVSLDKWHWFETINEAYDFHFPKETRTHVSDVPSAFLPDAKPITL